MKSKLLDKFKKNYEYLDFNDATVAMCFDRAYNELSSNNSLSESILTMEIGHLFLNYLIIEMKKGNKDIYDAISIAFECKHDFVIKKRPDITKNITDKTKAYEKAFFETIDSYNYEESFSSVLVKNLIKIYKSLNEKDREVNLMKYNMREKSLYKLFDNYDSNIVELLLNALKIREIGTYGLLVRKYGVSFDGVNAANNLTYSEVTRLDNCLSRIDSYLKFITLYISNGHTLSEVSKIFKEYNDNNLLAIIRQYSGDKKSSEAHVFRKTKGEVLKYFGVTESVLRRALNELENKSEIYLYNAYYGINTDALSIDAISRNTSLKEKEIESEVFKIQDKLVPIIEKLKKEKVQTKDTSNGRVQIKPRAKAFLDSSKYEKDKNTLKEEIIKEELVKEEVKVEEELIKQEPVLEKVEIKEESSKKTVDDNTLRKQAKRRKDYFIEYFYTDSMDDSVKDKMKSDLEKILEIPKVKELLGYSVASKLYGEKLDQKLTDFSLSREEKIRFRDFKKTMNSYFKKISLHTEKIKKTTKKSSRKKDYFIDYFTSDNTSLEDKEKLKEKLKAIITIPRYRQLKGFAIACKLYGNLLDEKLLSVELMPGDNTSFNNFKISIDTALKKPVEEFNTIGRRKREKYLVEYFLGECIDDDSKKLIISKFDIIIKLNRVKNLKGYLYASKLYGDDLKGSNSNIILKSNEGISFISFKNSIKNLIDSYSLEELNAMLDKESIKEKVDETCLDDKNEFIEEKKEVLSSDVEKEYSYIDKLILKLHKELFSEDEIKKVLLLDDNTIVDTYIKCLGDLDLFRALDYIVLRNPNRIKDLLSSTYFKPLTEKIDDVELEVIYLKLLSKSNPSITDSIISSITSVPLKDIEEYKIMSIDDSMNNLNNYLYRDINPYIKLKNNDKKSKC